MCTMYCVRLIDLLLLLTTFSTLVNVFIDCQRCKSGMKYHSHSETCIVVVNVNKTHEDAERYCADTYSGGHLVYILDSETNNFTNSLLRENELYHIGLSDKIKNGDYIWTNGQTANYRNFKTDHTPKENLQYVLMRNNIWFEYYYLESKFICQKSAERREFFFLNDIDFVDKTKETDVLTRIIWKCGIHDEKYHQSQILYRNFKETDLLLSKFFGTEHSHVTDTHCNSSGVYVCQITDNVKTTVATLAGTLKVKCRATYCNQTNTNINLLVHDDTGYADGTICVFVYPRPTLENIIISKENTSKSAFKLKHNINFSYTDEISNRGEFHIRIYNVTPSDYGRYYIHARNDMASKLYFKLTGPPQCPINLTSEELAHEMVRLTWLPLRPSEETFEQIFDIFQADPTIDIKLATVSNQNEEFISYIVTGLTSNRNYSFYLQVKSGQFMTQCRNLATWVEIKGTVRHSQGDQASKTNILYYILPIVLVVVLVICVVITVMVRKRNIHNKINNTFIDQQELKYYCGVETVSPQQSSQSYTYNGNGAEVPMCSTEAAENIYNNVLEHKSQQDANGLKPARKSGSSVELNEDNSLATGDHHARTLPHGKTLVTWGDEKDDAKVYENTQNGNSKQAQGLNDHRKETAVPSNYKEIPNIELNKHKFHTDENFQTVSAEGLVYVSVEINRSSQTPKIVVQKPKVADKKNTKDNKKKEIVKEVKEVKPSYDAVEYSSLDYLATSVAASDTDTYE